MQKYEVWTVMLNWNVREELACEEAELGPDKFAEKLQLQQKLQEAVQIIYSRKVSKVCNKANYMKSICWTLLQQLEMLKQIRNYHLDDQSLILEKVRANLNRFKRQYHLKIIILKPELSPYIYSFALIDW